MIMSRRRSGRRKKHSAQSSAALERNGLKAFQSADYDRAIDAWERAAEQTPDRMPTAALAEAYFRRGLKHLRASDLEASLADLQHAAELEPGDPCYAHHLGLAAFRLGVLDRAIRSFAVARRGGTEFVARAAYPLALALLARGDDPSTHAVWSALSEREQAMLRHATAFRRRPYDLPSDAPTLWRALSALDGGDREGARRALERVLGAAPTPLERSVAHYYLGVLAAEAEHWEETARHWNVALAAGYDSPWLEENVAELYHRLAEDRLQGEDVEGALQAAAEALRLKPGDSRLQELVSQAYQREAYQAASQSRWEAALDRWQEANEIGGSSFRLAYNLALAHEHAEEWVMAGETWREALRRRPRRADHPDAITDEEVARLWRRAAEAYDRAGEYEEAVDVYRQALKWNPDDLQTRMALAEGLLNDGRWIAAQNELDRILERDPDHIPALLRIGEAIAANEYWWQRSAAPSYWRRVLELDPDNASARQSLVDFFQDQAEDWAHWGNYALAIEPLEQALELQPHNGRTLATLGTCYLGMDDEDRAQSYFERALAEDPQNLEVYHTILQGWLGQDDPDRAGETMARAEAAIEDVPSAFYISEAALCLQSDYDELARPWLERAVATAPPGEPVLAMIGEMAMMAEAPDIAREYLERAIEANQARGLAYMVLGVLSVLTDHDLDAANKHWRRAEQIARKEDDAALMERIDIARTFFSAPPGLLSLLGQGLFGPGGLDLDDLDLDLFDDDLFDEDFSDEDFDDDDF
jgi:tetratricopeptide (TPR) repeat protein